MKQYMGQMLEETNSYPNLQVPGHQILIHLHPKDLKKLVCNLNVMRIAKDSKQVPGPGHYQHGQAMSTNGNYFYSKFHSSCCRKFSIADRDACGLRGTFLSTPGPGTYIAPSEFGIYEAKPKFVKEHIRTDEKRRKTSTGDGDKRKIKLLVDGTTTANSLFSRTNSQPSPMGKGRSTESIIKS